MYSKQNDNRCSAPEMIYIWRYILYLGLLTAQ